MFIELSVIGKIFHKCKGLEKSQFYKLYKELQCADLVFKQTFQLLDQPPVCYNAVSNSTSNPFPHFLLPMTLLVDCPPCLIKCQTIAYTLCMLSYSRSSHEGLGFFKCARATWILAVASIQERRLFREQWLIESGIWSSEYGMHTTKLCSCTTLLIRTKWTRYSALLTPQPSIDPYLLCSAAIIFQNIT